MSQSRKSLKRELKEAKREHQQAKARLEDVRAHQEKVRQHARDRGFTGELIEMVENKVFERKSDMNAEEFWDMASKPDFDDHMSFQLTVEHPDLNRTFSKDGIDTITNQMHDFIIARIFAQFRKSGRGPRELQADVKLHWRSHPDYALDMAPSPWYSLVDHGEGLHLIDGTNRLLRVDKP